jgi:hypothetical protein
LDPLGYFRASGKRAELIKNRGEKTVATGL